MLKLMGQDSAGRWPSRTPGDRRFKHEDWQQNFLYDYIKQSYLIAARHLHQTVGKVEGLDEQTAKKVDFYTRQYIDALSPSNFLLTNPEVLRETVATGGQNLVKGLNNLLEDLARGGGDQLRLRMTDENAFKLGVNIATTPGKVVFQNDLIQLIQYYPASGPVFRRPLLIIPPWINKYYILDLREKNSFVKWAVEQGHTVFVVSWVNPDEKLAHKRFEDYLTEGTLAALDAIEKATGEREVNVIGYCLGGTLLACTLGYLAAKSDGRIASATFFASMIDFEEAGELEVFIDEQQVAALEKRMKERGYLEGSEMATTFNMLRANDLIWSFVVNNYLLGRDPFPFDLLYWNSDSTRMPASMHSYYLRNMYIKNLLAKPGGIELGRRADRPRPGADAALFRIHPRGSHRAVALDLCRGEALHRPGAFRAWRLRPHRGHRQPAGGRASTATGPTRSCPMSRSSGSRAHRSTRVRGGRTGRAGSRSMAATRCRRGFPARAGLKAIEDAPGLLR